MFYCETCKNLKSWPGIIPTSYGYCEVCKQRHPCYDYPSYMLPDTIDPDANNILKEIVDDGE